MQNTGYIQTERLPAKNRSKTISSSTEGINDRPATTFTLASMGIRSQENK